MARRKASPGVCGRCGRAVVRPTPAALAQADDLADLAGRGEYWVAGHHYTEGRLDRVRCRDCKPPDPGWDRMPECS